MEKTKQELEKIVRMLNGWKIMGIEYKKAFVRSDGIPMLYIKAKSKGKGHYIHIEGIVKEGSLRYYAKLTRNDKNKHGHRDEIIGWDNLYNDEPHIHFNEDEKREYREISWEETKRNIEEMEED